MILTFFLAVIGWIIFRAESIGQAWEYVCGMLQFGTFKASYRFFTWSLMWPTNVFIIVMLLVEWLQRGKEHGLELSNIKYVWVRTFIYYCFGLVLILGSGKSSTFIYFQF